MMMNSKRFILALGSLLISFFGSSRDYAISMITVGELHDHYVHCIYKDTDGFIWIGTGTSIERWDGVKSRPYLFPEDNLEYAPYLVNAIIEREKHDYWIGCKRGLWRLSVENNSLKQYFPEQLNFPVYALGKGKNDNIYIGTENGIYVYDGNHLRLIPVMANNIPATTNKVIAIEINEENQVWLMTHEGIALCDPVSGTIKFYPNPLPAAYGSFLSLAKAEQRFFIGTDKGIILAFDLCDNRYTTYWNEIQSPVSALSYEEGYLAVATSGEGIRLLSLKNEQLAFSATYNPQKHTGIASNSLSSILLSEGHIWSGTDHYAGMIHLREKNENLQVYSKGEFNSEGVSTRSVYLSSNHTLISNRDGFVSIRKDNGEVRYFNRRTVGRDKLRSDLIFSFYEYGGNILIGTYAGGVSVMNPNNYTFLETPLTRQITTKDIFMFLEDKEQNLWIATSDGLYLYEKHTRVIKEYNTFNSGIPGNTVCGIYIDSADRFWVATNRGLALFDRVTETFSQEKIPEIRWLKHEPARSIYEGKDGTLFFCLLNNVKMLYVSDKDLKYFWPLPIDVGYLNITQDHNDNYWIGTDLGIMRMGSDLNHLIFFPSSDDLPDFTITAGSVFDTDTDNRLLLPSNKGIIVINPYIIPHSSPLKITEVFANGELAYSNYTQQAKTPFLLKRSKNNLIFRFMSLGYEDIGKARYEYMLMGIDSTWIRLDHENKVTYYDLPPQKYTFKVRKFLDGDSMDEVSFVIRRGFPLLAASIFLLLLTLLLAVILFFRYKKRSLPQTVSGETWPKKEENDKAESEPNVKLTKEEADKFIDLLKEYMEQEKPYLNVDLKQSDIAAKLGYSTYILSAIFTHYLKTGYYDFVNAYRVEEFKRRIKAGDHKKYSLFNLGEQCGFKSRTSFFRSFKKLTGFTPNEYIQQTQEYHQ